VARRLLEDDELDWFRSDKQEALLDCARETVRSVKTTFGADPAGWIWRRVHLAHFRHPLSNPLLAEHFDAGPAGISGGASTLRNTGLGSDFGSTSGAEYQLLADLGEGPAFLALQNMGQSGQPGSPHYRDQFPCWIAGDYRRFSLDQVDQPSATVRIDPEEGA
jgi:penicillin amidase